MYGTFLVAGLEIIKDANVRLEVTLYARVVANTRFEDVVEPISLQAVRRF